MVGGIGGAPRNPWTGRFFSVQINMVLAERIAQIETIEALKANGK